MIKGLDVQIEREIREFIARDLARDVEHVENGQSLLEAGILDSLGVVTLVSFIERCFGIGVTDDDLLPENFDSIEAIASFVTRRQAERA
jgi:acyl carrier protein